MTKCVRFERGVDGHVSVSASPDFRPLDDLLETDIGDNLDELRLIVENARQPGAGTWGFGGDSCHITGHAEEVLVENDFTGQRVTLSRTEFLSILEEYAQVVSGQAST